MVSIKLDMLFYVRDLKIGINQTTRFLFILLIVKQLLKLICRVTQ